MLSKQTIFRKSEKKRKNILQDGKKEGIPVCGNPKGEILFMNHAVRCKGTTIF